MDGIWIKDSGKDWRTEEQSIKKRGAGARGMTRDWEREKGEMKRGRERGREGGWEYDRRERKETD